MNTPTRDEMMIMAEKAGVAPNTILHFEAAFLRFAELLSDHLSKQTSREYQLPYPAAEVHKIYLYPDHEGPVEANQSLPIGTLLFTAEQMREAYSLGLVSTS